MEALGLLLSVLRRFIEGNVNPPLLRGKIPVIEIHIFKGEVSFNLCTYIKKHISGSREGFSYVSGVTLDYSSYQTSFVRWLMD